MNVCMCYPSHTIACDHLQPVYSWFSDKEIEDECGNFDSSGGTCMLVHSFWKYLKSDLPPKRKHHIVVGVMKMGNIVPRVELEVCYHYTT